MTTLEAVSCKSFLVYVCYEEETPSNHEIAAIFNTRSDDFLEIVVINTNRSTRIGEQIVSSLEANRFFEFSGYELGLRKILREHKFATARVIFVNSTVVGQQSFHSLYFKLLKIALACDNSPISTGRISGLVRMRKDYRYIPTCFFEILGSRKAMSEVVFVPDWLKRTFSSVNQEDFHHLGLYVGDKEEYLARQADWLNPKSLLRGWYQAPFFKPLDRDVYRRKQVTIFLEHSLLSNNSSFEILDLQAADKWLPLLEKANRLKIMAWKITNRLSYLLYRNV